MQIKNNKINPNRNFFLSWQKSLISCCLARTTSLQFLNLSSGPPQPLHVYVKFHNQFTLSAVYALIRVDFCMESVE